MQVDLSTFGLRHQESSQIFIWPNCKLLYLCLNGHPHCFNILCVPTASIISLTEVKLSPEDACFGCISVQSVPHAVAVHDMDLVVWTRRNCLSKDIVDRIRNFQLLCLVRKASWVLVQRIVSLAIRNKWVENVCLTAVCNQWCCQNKLSEQAWLSYSRLKLFRCFSNHFFLLWLILIVWRFF